MVKSVPASGGAVQNSVRLWLRLEGLMVLLVATYLFARTEASWKADAEIDDDLKTVLLTAMDRHPEKRDRSIEDMYAALAAYLESIWPGRPWR